MKKILAADVLTMGDLARASGARITQLEPWCRNGIVLSDSLPRRFRTRRTFTGATGAIAILDATEARELTAAGYSNPQILRRFAVQRAALAGLAPDAALVVRFKCYIDSITRLAHLFGRGPGFEPWLATQQGQLARMEKALRGRDGKQARAVDDRVINLLAAAVPEENAPPALAS